MNWYFSVNNNYNFDAVKVAVISAIYRSSLNPICVTEELNDRRKSWLVNNGVKVVIVTHPIFDAIDRHYGNKLLISNLKNIIIRYLMCELVDDESIFYTDTDILFANNVDDIFNFCRTAVSVLTTNNVDTNTILPPVNCGVMVFSKSKFMTRNAEFQKFLLENVESGRFNHGSDQTIFNSYWNHLITPLDYKFNYVINVDPNPSIYTNLVGDINPAVVHFYQPKPWLQTDDLLEHMRTSASFMYWRYQWRWWLSMINGRDDA